MKNWISVDVELPKKDTPVLVFQPNEKKQHEQFVCAYDGSNWRELNTDGEKDSLYEQLTWFDEITHWMPLPKSPTGEPVLDVEREQV